VNTHLQLSTFLALIVLGFFAYHGQRWTWMATAATAGVTIGR